MAGSLEKGSTARVTFEYEGQSPDELSLNVGDIITNLSEEEDAGWLAGTLNGKRGVFPDNFVQIIPPSSSAAQPAAASTAKETGTNGPNAKRKLVKISFPYEATADDELSLEVGDIVEIDRDDEPGWLVGTKLTGSKAKGLFPDNFSTPISVEEGLAAVKEAEGNSGKPAKSPSTATSAPTKKTSTASAPSSRGKQVSQKAKVTFPYEAAADDELTLKEGDVLEITSTDIAPGWWEGRLNGKLGIFPDNFVTVIQDTPEVPEQKPPPAQAPPPKPAPAQPGRPKPPSKDKQPPRKPPVKLAPKKPVKEPNTSPEARRPKKSPEQKRSIMPNRPALTKPRSNTTGSAAVAEPDFGTLNLEVASKPLTHITHNRAAGRAGRRLPTKFANRASMPPTAFESHTPSSAAKAEAAPVPSRLEVNAGPHSNQWRKSAPSPVSSSIKPLGDSSKIGTSDFSRLQADAADFQARIIELEKKWRAETNRLANALKEERDKRKALEQELADARRARPRLRLT